MDAGSQERRSGTLTRECEGVKPEGRLVETGVEDRGVWQREPELGDRDSLEGSGSCGRSCVHAAGPGPGWLGAPGSCGPPCPAPPLLFRCPPASLWALPSGSTEQLCSGPQRPWRCIPRPSPLLTPGLCGTGSVTQCPSLDARRQPRASVAPEEGEPRRP